MKKGYVDYLLWGDDGRPLGLVEAKRTRRDAREGQQQAKLYADCLQKRFGQRPVIFYSNGYEHWLWDDAAYPPRQVQGFYKKAELELMVQRRETRKRLAGAEINEAIVERYYQTRAIRRIAEAFERDRERKALLVMATGAGKTRTVIALCDLLMRCNWVKRVLFLSDRVALVKQAVNAFKAHLPDSSPVNLVTEKDGAGRVFVSTYPTMMGLIDESREGMRRFGPGHFDLVVIDEAHRSVFQKYRAIFDYFDSFLVGLTATPKDEVDRNTYSLFDLEDGVPTDAYSMDEAVRDGFLMPVRAVSVPLKFQREGIKYEELSEEDKDQWDALEWDEEGEVPDKVEAEAVNKWLFNEDTVDKVLAHLMTRGIRVAGGDRLGKTIIFAKNQAHADYIARRFDVNYPHLKGRFARTITFKTEYAQSLIDSFSCKDKDPHIAVSVDMLDTGIDVHEIVNLVFFKVVRSKTKFWQMVGRGTRLCPDLFEPGRDKACFYLFDYCRNLEYFSQDMPTTDGAVGDSLGKRLFDARLELIEALDKRSVGARGNAWDRQIDGDEPRTEAEVRWSASDILHREVAAMNLDNFVVRPRRRLVEKYANISAWGKVGPEDISELSREVAGLPAELESENEEAKRFDLLTLSLQLALLSAEPGFERLREKVVQIASLLEEKASIPMVREQMALIQEVQIVEWWQDITVPMLELLRRRLRGLVQFIEKRSRKPIYTDFEDLIGSEAEFVLSGFAGGPEELRRAAEESQGLGLFVRSLIGLDRGAAKSVMAAFMAGKGLNSSQIEFVNLIVDHLTEHGTVEARVLYESPFTDLASRGPDALFAPEQFEELLRALDAVRSTAIAA
jgi:type I restriction enzyme R subunit